MNVELRSDALPPPKVTLRIRDPIIGMFDPNRPGYRKLKARVGHVEIGDQIEGDVASDCRQDPNTCKALIIGMFALNRTRVTNSELPVPAKCDATFLRHPRLSAVHKIRRTEITAEDIAKANPISRVGIVYILPACLPHPETQAYLAPYGLLKEDKTLRDENKDELTAWGMGKIATRLRASKYPGLVGLSKELNKIRETERTLASNSINFLKTMIKSVLFPRTFISLWKEFGPQLRQMVSKYMEDAKNDLDVNLNIMRDNLDDLISNASNNIRNIFNFKPYWPEPPPIPAQPQAPANHPGGSLFATKEDF